MGHGPRKNQKGVFINIFHDIFNSFFMSRVKNIIPKRNCDFVRKLEQFQGCATHWTRRTMHQGRVAHQAKNRSVKIHVCDTSEARGALGEARGALGFKPKICLETHELASSPHKIAGRLTSTTCAWFLKDKCNGHDIFALEIQVESPPCQ